MSEQITEKLLLKNKSFKMNLDIIEEDQQQIKNKIKK